MGLNEAAVAANERRGEPPGKAAIDDPRVCVQVRWS